VAALAKMRTERMTAAVPKRTRREAQTPAGRPPIGELLRARRAHHGWTLADVSRMTTISTSALSKIENGVMSPTYHTILQICDGLNIEISDLFDQQGALTGERARSVVGRRSIVRQHEGPQVENDLYTYRFLCTDVAHKRIVPMVVEVRAKSRLPMAQLWSHVGEEFVYVLSGHVVLHTEGYEPADLAPADCFYLDSTMGHAYLAAGEEPATLLVACSSATPNLAQTLRDVLRSRLRQRGRIDPEDVVDGS